MSLPAIQQTVTDLIDEYDQKAAAIADEITAFEKAVTKIEMAAVVQGTYAEPVVSPKPYIFEKSLQRNLLKSGWKALYNRLQIDRVASAKDKQLFDRTIEDPPELTFENVKATFGDYFMRPRYHILRGLAEVFSDLDPAYKSHSKVRIGVKGLPKRVILSSFGSTYGSYGKDKLRDICNALAAYRGQPSFEHTEMRAIDLAHDRGEDAVLDGREYMIPGGGSFNKETGKRDAEILKTVDRGVKVRKFNNGNAHVIFDKHALTDINRALAEFYGEVLPDAEDEDAEHAPSTAVAKDLQYYWTPREVIEQALDQAGIYGSHNYSGTPLVYKVLEPSCGDGLILDVIKEYGSKGFGIEVHPGRAAEARAKGHPVQQANFLATVPQPIFDKVVMNPPFYGRHYLKHVKHALKFLKPGGTLVAILPATAWYDHGELTGPLEGNWRDLPVGSFSAAGTNVPTGILTIDTRVMARRMAA